MKRKQIELKVKELYWLLGRKSQLSIENKLLIYKTTIIPIWTYGIEIRGCASKSSQAILQKAQPKILRMITNAPWHVSNLTLHEDLKIPIRPRSHIRKVRKTSQETGNTPQPFTAPFTGHWAAKTTEEDPARGPAMR